MTEISTRSWFNETSWRWVVFVSCPHQVCQSFSQRFLWHFHHFLAGLARSVGRFRALCLTTLPQSVCALWTCVPSPQQIFATIRRDRGAGASITCVLNNTGPVIYVFVSLAGTITSRFESGVSPGTAWHFFRRSTVNVSFLTARQESGETGSRWSRLKKLQWWLQLRRVTVDLVCVIEQETNMLVWVEFLFSSCFLWIIVDYSP